MLFNKSCLLQHLSYISVRNISVFVYLFINLLIYVDTHTHARTHTD